MTPRLRRAGGTAALITGLVVTLGLAGIDDDGLRVDDMRRSHAAPDAEPTPAPTRTVRETPEHSAPDLAGRRDTKPTRNSPTPAATPPTATRRSTAAPSPHPEPPVPACSTFGSQATAQSWRAGHGRPAAMDSNGNGRPCEELATGTWTVTVDGWARTIERGGQDTIDECRSAALWGGPLPGRAPGTTWLAGHNYCGFHRWDSLSVGATFTITDPSGRVQTYTVTGRNWVGRQSGSAAGLIRGDLTLQTCRGHGTAFTYADRIS